MTLLYEGPSSASGWIPQDADIYARTSLDGPVAKKRRSFISRIASEGGVVFLVSFAAYFTIAMLLDFKYHSFQGDAVARMANGFYMLHSNDPHLAAVGFVWNPLSSIADLPLLAFNSVWPVLASHNVAGTTVSAIAMACAAYQLNALLREWGVAILPRLILTAFFVLNPMVLYSGGNGMSEALYLFAMLAATRYLVRWLGSGDLPSLVYCAIALAVGYLERSEPVAAAGLTAMVVFGVSFARTAGDRHQKVWASLTDTTILILPILTSLVGWAAVSWVITGQPFQQFTSKYGNTSLIAESHLVGNMTSRLIAEAKAITYMSPLLVLIIVLAIVVAIIRRNVQLLGVFAVLGGGLGFTLASYLTNAIFPWFRYYIVVAPLAVLLVGSIISRPTRPPRKDECGPLDLRVQTASVKRRPTTNGVLASLGGVALVLLLLVPSIPGTAMAMSSDTVAPDLAQYTGFIFHKNLTPIERSGKYAYAQVQSMSAYLDARRFSNGDVVVDNANSCIPYVDTNVDNPRMFVIHNDRDFERVLADPLIFHAHYLLVGLAADNDAVLAQYPTIGKSTPWAKLVHTFRYPTGGFCDGYRLFKVTGYPTGNY